MTCTTTGSGSATPPPADCPPPLARTSTAAGPALSGNAGPFALATPVAVASSVYEPAVVRFTALKVAMPATAVAVVTPWSVAPAGPVPTASVTTPEKLVATLPVASRVSTVIGSIVTPAVAPATG